MSPEHNSDICEVTADSANADWLAEWVLRLMRLVGLY